MKTFQFYADYEVKGWRRVKYTVKANSPEEAERLAIEGAKTETFQNEDYETLAHTMEDTGKLEVFWNGAVNPYKDPMIYSSHQEEEQ